MRIKRYFPMPRYGALAALTAVLAVLSIPSPASTPVLATSAATSCPASGKQVANATQLQQALATATPGTTILMAPGTYSGKFVASKTGTAAAPITLCGPREAVINGGSLKSGYALHLNAISYWNVIGFTVTGAQKGVVADHTSHVLISGLYVHTVGDEAIHLREYSSYNTIDGVLVRDTGHHRAKYGEGIYIGSANGNWCDYTGCAPDTSDYNRIQNSDIAQTTAENVDIKEGTTGRVMLNNHLSGLGMVSAGGKAWVDVKGNAWTLTGNVGQTSIQDGFQVHQVYGGWGLNNAFRSNQAYVNGPGYGYYVQSARLGTVLACNNVAAGAKAGFSNIPCNA